jgi:hypothetical protein
LGSQWWFEIAGRVGGLVSVGWVLVLLEGRFVGDRSSSLGIRNVSSEHWMHKHNRQSRERRKIHTLLILNPTSLPLPLVTPTPSALTTSTSLTSFTGFPSSSFQPQSLKSATRHPSPCSQAVVLMDGTSTAPAPGRILVMHCEKTTMAILRVAASFWSELIKNWRIGNLRDNGLGAVKC